MIVQLSNELTPTDSETTSKSTISIQINGKGNETTIQKIELPKVNPIFETIISLYEPFHIFKIHYRGLRVNS